MYSPTKQDQRNRRRSIDNGKCICLSFPAHETGLIEDLDALADSEFITRSQYIRRIIRREKRALSDQRDQRVAWTSLVGEK